MQTDARIGLAALRKAWLECSTARPVVPLRTKLLQESGAAFDVIAGGEFRSTSGSNRHVTLAGSDSNGPSQSDISVMWTYLIELYDRAVVDLGQVSDALLEARMETYLRPVYGTNENWMYLQK
jgi:hypothetical protein